MPPADIRTTSVTRPRTCARNCSERRRR
jgi:hypothetical protein